MAAETWIIADTHFCCQPKDRLKATGKTAAELDALVIAAWQDSVAPEDEVWHLGDVGDFSVLADLPGQKRLVWGNGESKGAAAASNQFALVAKRHMLDGIELVHDPKDSRSDGPVFHGHLHAGRTREIGLSACRSIRPSFTPSRFARQSLASQAKALIGFSRLTFT